VSRLASDHPEIQELDLNPVVVFPGNRPCFALDARMRIARVGSPAGAAHEKDTPAPEPVEVAVTAGSNKR
jgi:ATP-grasp domain-containing protein